jgi:hypothetical protein
MDRIALKRLTASDLTFFQYHYEHHNAGNQKALNLSRNVFIDELYPSLADSSANAKLPVALYIYGPGSNPEIYALQRKILKTASYKNWRLNGEFIYSPENDTTRFNKLKPDDIAVMDFIGNEQPTEIHINFVAADEAADGQLHEELGRYLGNPRGNMKRVTREELTRIVKAANPVSEHPINRFILNDDIIEAVQGDSQARLRVYRHTGRLLTSDELKKAKQNAEDIGRMGEELIDSYLQHQLDTGTIAEYEWISFQNAIAPFDFKIVEKNGTTLYVDVKSTKNDFNVPLHISTAEIFTMATIKERYSIYRVYNLSKAGGKLRIAHDMRGYAQSVLDAFKYLPVGTQADSISCAPDVLSFSEESELHFYEEGE